MTDQDNNPASPSSTDKAITNLYELLREGFGHLIERDRDERRWKVAKRTVLGGVTLGAIAMWVTLYAPLFGWSSGPTESSLGVVPIQGEIGGSGAAAVDSVIPEFRPTLTFQDRIGLSAMAREFGVGLTHGMTATRWE